MGAIFDAVPIAVQFVGGNDKLVVDNTVKEEFWKLLKANWNTPLEGIAVLRKFGGEA